MKISEEHLQPMPVTLNTSALLSTQWVSVEEKLPPAGIYVLIHLKKDNWIDSKDPTGLYYKVASLRKGISNEEREKMKSGEIPDPELTGFHRPVVSIKRSSMFSAGDQHGNNLKPYSWQEFGPSSYFGQEVDYWMPIPNLPQNNMKEANGKFVPPEDCGSEIRKDMTVESVRKACEAARDARVKRFKLLEENETRETSP